MENYPNSDEEFELMYEDELELLKDTPDSFTVSTQKQTPKNNENNQLNEPSTSQLTNISDLLILDDITNITTKKRTVEELFGDVDDIFFETNTNTTKKLKLDDENEKLKKDLNLIEEILELRKINKEKQNFLISSTNRNFTNKNKDKYNLSYTVPKYPCLPITKHNGERIYIRFHSESYEDEEIERVIKESSRCSDLGRCFDSVWDQAQELLNNQLDNTKAKETEIEGQYIDDSNQLWVDLYKPRKYIELLSDESTNRVMLKWMKLWDKIVFHRKPKIRENPQNNKDDRWKNFKKFELNTQLDEFGRPEHKVALLCGPPGLGKTTLAHMVAKHAGYNVVEINASDERSIESFQKILENSTQMRSVIDKENRPNCLVFDEIDGAPSAAIDYLVKFITFTPTSDKNNVGNKRTKKKNLLKRPIICICNDIYVPSLRPLRQIAFVVNFPPISSSCLAERLMEIARRQCIRTHQTAMLALAEKSNNDIRSCLSVLHFFKALNKPVTLNDIYHSNVGDKDMKKGLFSLWQSIFQIETKPISSTTTIDPKQIIKERARKILNFVNNFGDYERLSMGVFENYLLMKLKQTNFDLICTSLDWFCHNDVLLKKIHTEQNYLLMPYLSYAFIVWHFAFGSRTWQKLQYPSGDFEARIRTIRAKSIVDELLRGIKPTLRIYYQPQPLILDMFPYLTSIIAPILRNVNHHLYTEDEKRLLSGIVGIMVNYNLNFVQERTAEGLYIYKLDPNIETFAFDLERIKYLKNLPYIAKQVISKEIEKEKLRNYQYIDDDTKSIERKSKPLPNHLQTLSLNRKKKVTTATIQKDFFNRTPINQTKSNDKIQNNNHEKNDIICFQFKEGYSNAVRKNLKIASLKY